MILDGFVWIFERRPECWNVEDGVETGKGWQTVNGLAGDGIAGWDIFRWKYS